MIVFYRTKDKLTILPNARNILIKANWERFEQLWTTVDRLSLAKIQGITIWTKDETSMRRLVEQRFRIIEAAGGVVSKGDQILLIHRLGKWDLPKGKVEKGEQKITAAVREIMEECSVQVVPITKLCSTWHTYTRDRVAMLKETTWYAMACIDDTTMRPQLEEGIDKVSWLSEAELNEVLNNSYTAVRYVINTHRSYAAFATARKLLG